METATNQLDVVRVFLIETCRALDWLGAVYYVVDAASPRHLTATVQTFMEGRLEPNVLVALAHRMPAEDFEGIGGRVVDTGKPAWVDDVLEAPNIHVPEEAAAAGLRGALAIPVYLGLRLGAVVEFFSDRPIHATDELLEQLTTLGRIAGGKIRDLPPGATNLGTSM